MLVTNELQERYEVEAAIRATGAILIYGAPYSPHLNPIENYCYVYKRHVKRNSARMNVDWRSVHMEALNVVDRDCGIIKYSLVAVFLVREQ